MHLTKCGSLMQIWSVANHLKGTHGLPGTVTVMPARHASRFASVGTSCPCADQLSA